MGLAATKRNRMSEGPPEDLTHWLLGAVASLATAIAAMWKRNESRNAKEISKLEARIKRRDTRMDELEQHVDECNRDRGELRIQLARMETRLGVLDDNAHDGQ